ncbi:MAG: phosphoribosylformylglycinamidine synthase [Nitrospirae bacterium]|nr:phosphoribosylformylglycinamidine synthase [Nitrospirota bacterium]
MSLTYAYRKPVLSEAGKENLLSRLRRDVSPGILDIESEYCFYIESREPLEAGEYELLHWLLRETFEPENFSVESFLVGNAGPETPDVLLEVGPRMNFTTAWSTNAVSVCHACGLKKILRIERSRRYRLVGTLKSEVTSQKNDAELLSSLITRHSSLFYDRMTECPYRERLTSFETGMRPEPVREVRVIEEGRAAIEGINRELGLGLDKWDIDYYYSLFADDLGRNPTNVECFDLGQSNSEHSRHWFFRGKLIINGQEMPQTLMEIVKEPYRKNPRNSVIAFKDNSSAIQGYGIRTLIPLNPGRPSPFLERELVYHIIFTAETHNFPSGVAPFPGAETGTGGRIRDVQAAGRGGLVAAGTAAYCVGNLRIPGYELPWEDGSFAYPENLASPLQIEIEASNGASDYGNKFGEPVIQGYTRSFGMRLPGGERREWIKPIMFTGGVGQMDAGHVAKGEPDKGMLIVKIGGPAYRIGIGGGAASSMIQGENVEELDFNAVQRGDAEMEQKMNRVIRACIELGEENPIISIHDQGAGGNCNVIKELIYPAGARIEIRKIPLGDNTLSVLEIWGAEYQEDNALLIRPEKAEMFEALCSREKVPFAFIGQITGDGYIVLYDEHDGSTPVNLDLGKVLGEMPQKTFMFERTKPLVEPLGLAGVTVNDALERVLKLLSVGSKRFLTNKVDRSVTGLIARQQCTGPLQLTVSDVAVVAQSHFGVTGAALSIGEQPVKGLIDPGCMARMSVAEALTNIVWAKISALEDIRCSANWMWPAKLPGEGAALYDAAVAMRDLMEELGIAVDGGKDSLSMAAVVPREKGGKEIVKAPGSLVISAYATCPDVTKVVTPDIKKPGGSRLLLVEMGEGKHRLGGSALAQVYGQIGDDSPDIEDAALLKRAFTATQKLVDEGLILSGHDVSDGGLIVALLEMAFSGNCGLQVTLGNVPGMALSLLFAEEAGLVMEYPPAYEDAVFQVLRGANLDFRVIGETLSEKSVTVLCGGEQVLVGNMEGLRALWEETSYRLDRLQANPECVDEEKKNIFERTGPRFALPYTPGETPPALLSGKFRPAVAVIREEGSNGDREMTSAFHSAGFETWDISMTDLLKGEATLDGFRGIAFVGGFSYADVLDSAKGWAGAIRFHRGLYGQFRRFYERQDTFSLGVCNGCQLMALLGWVPWQGIEDALQPRFIRNRSGRFESRFASVKILPSPSVLLKGMEGSTLGIWVAHGEGRAHFPDEALKQKVLAMNIAPVRYVDDGGTITESYPFNPNGSPEGIAALCSPDGRHLAVMPHPERTFLKWQWPWMPEEWRNTLGASPWLRMFQNARLWCEGNA